METALYHPEQILSQLEIGHSAIIADFGCGSGYFSLPLAKIADQGTVYALDVIKDALEAVENKAKLEEVSNIRTVHCNLEISGSSKLEDNSVDLVLMRNILFQSQKKAEILREAKRVLREQDQLVVIEWIPGSSMAPKEGWLLSREEAQQLAKAEGFKFDRELDMDEQHYGLVFKK